ncbi:MAG: lysine 2,3-aminomutase [Planctomycetes bacterium]|nr:lysine 2,3-aminomutase [Planctomycetota bacterium]
MPKQITVEPRSFQVYTRRDLDRIPQLQRFSSDELWAMKAVAQVLPFRVNRYVIDELIDWEHVPDDPMFQLAFPQPGMLPPGELDRMVDLLQKDATEQELQHEAKRIQRGLNPHPAGQVELNVPHLDGKPLPGMQHKYRETVLFFPSSGQTCHTYCTYCFRWPQFVGLDELKFAAREADQLANYLKAHPEVNSVLFTGGDPMVMKARVLRRYLEPLLAEELDHIVSIRIGTKAPAWWPHRFVTDDDADELMRLFEEVHQKGRHLAIMAHYSHPRELSTPVAQAALERLQNAGATVRCQAPLIRRVNDAAETWADLWKRQIVLGAVPYYMFVERDTGPRHWFEVPLARALDIFTVALRRVSGLGRTVRGPSMSATPGKVLVDGVAEVHGEKVFVLKFLQARDPSWVNRVFFAKYDEQATWLDELKPAFGEKQWWFQPVIKMMKKQGWQPSWGDRSRVRKRVTHFGHVEWE